MAYVLSTSGAAIAKAGANYDKAVSGAILQNFNAQAESDVCFLSRRDWISDYPTISGSNYIWILDDIVSDMTAMKMINYNMSGFTSRNEAQTMLDVLRDNITKNIDALKDDKHRSLL